MKLWTKGYKTEQLVEQFTVGNDRILDHALAKFDILGSIAHAKMLHSIDILAVDELEAMLNSLQVMLKQVEAGEFTIEEEFEDIHSKIEFELVKEIGDVGKKIHTARSRNDQVLVDLHLYAKSEIAEIKELVSTLFNTLITLAEKHKSVLIPGYTHMQVAMPSSIGMWLSAYAESLIDDIVFLNAAFTISDQNPLGSAAGYGSSFPINRTMTTELLGFATLKYNSVAAQMSRGKLEKTTSFALASVAGTLSKFAADVCLYMSQNFNFIGFPKELTTGSSIMPHKQNPDVFELIRAKSNKVQSLPTEIQMLTNNLTSGYHRDFQLIKESFMEGIETTKSCLQMTTFMLEHLIVKEGILDNPIYDYMYSVEAVNKLVIEGATFRDAYQTLGKAILEGNFKPEKEVHHTHEGSIGNLCLGEIKEKFKQAMRNSLHKL